MPVDRPTFSESWYRVIELRPRLRNSVQVYRQHYRGQTWYVVQDPANNQFYRLNEAAYHFVGMLDGQRTVGQVWAACNEELGDDSPTQGEAIQLLGQLYVSNLIQADLPPDTESMFRRHKQRKTREISGYLMNLLFARIPLYDPDQFLNRWVGIIGWVFSPVGAVLWLLMLGFALFRLAGQWGELMAEGQAVNLLKASNLPLLYVCMAVIKALHEFGHAFACKRFGKKNGSGGEVHVMGVMLLVFTPMPYVDASSAWAFDSKWQRIVVGLGGMLIELFLAAIAALVWASTAGGTTVHELAFNIIFVAGVSTVLFNANPLLRYDGYYILADALEIPNLWQRSREYLYYLVKKYVWGVRRPRCPSQRAAEKAWMLAYSLCSVVYRTFICMAILFYVASALPMMGLVLAMLAVFAWLLVPLGKFFHYLLANQELMRCRGRALSTTAAFVLVSVFVLGFINMPDHIRSSGVTRPLHETVVYAKEDGFLEEFAPTNFEVKCGAEEPRPVLFRLRNLELEKEREALLAERRKVQSQLRLEQGRDLPTYQGLLVREKAVERQLKRTEESLAKLVVQAPHDGLWVAGGVQVLANGQVMKLPELDHLKGAFLQKGQPVGKMVDACKLQIETVIGQDEAARVFQDLRQGDPGSPQGMAEIRLPGLAGTLFRGQIVARIPAGQKQLPSPAMSTAGGGEVPTNPRKRGETIEPFFTVVLEPVGDHGLRAGQMVAVRFDLPERSLARQFWRWLRQLLQKKFQV